MTLVRVYSVSGDWSWTIFIGRRSVSSNTVYRSRRGARADVERFIKAIRAEPVEIIADGGQRTMI